MPPVKVCPEEEVTLAEATLAAAPLGVPKAVSRDTEAAITLALDVYYNNYILLVPQRVRMARYWKVQNNISGRVLRIQLDPPAVKIQGRLSSRVRQVGHGVRILGLNQSSRSLKRLKLPPVSIAEVDSAGAKLTDWTGKVFTPDTVVSGVAMVIGPLAASSVTAID